MKTNRKKFIKVALAGNPNVGKSVVFNNLTGSRQHIGNWPGKTVDKKEGIHVFKDKELYIVDLPGTYSLTAFSIEEKIARDYIIYEKPDVVVDVIDASNLERNLYLALQLLELGVNLVIAFNKVDLVEKEKTSIDVKGLQKELGVVVIPTVAPRKEGMEDLVKAIVAVARSKKSKKIHYNPKIEKYITKLESIVTQIKIGSVYKTRWIAIKLLEGDRDVEKKISDLKGGRKVLKKVAEMREKMEKEVGDPEAAVADARYELINKILSRVVKRKGRLTASDLVDQALLDKYLSIPIFLVILWWALQFAFIGSAPFCDFLGDSFAYVGNVLKGITGQPYIDYLLFGNYGIVQGLGVILSFVPLIMFLFFVLALLEDSGYMARAAFVMDRIMRKLGLSGRSIIPMIMGVGCNVPAVYATRIIPNENDRMIAILTNPLIMCSARLVFFSAIAAAFFGVYAGDVILSLYILGFLLVFIVAVILRRTLFKGKPSSFVIEFPVYQKPSFKSAVVRMWDRGSLFFKKAGSVILLGLIVIGILTTTDASTFKFTNNPENTIISVIGKSLQPIFAPLGWDWRLVVAALFGFVAKEIVLGASAMLYGVGEGGIASKMASMYSPIDMFGYMAFIQIYIPCIVTVAAIKQETGSWKWAAFTVVYGVILAYAINWMVLVIGHGIFG